MKRVALKGCFKEENFSSKNNVKNMELIISTIIKFKTYVPMYAPMYVRNRLQNYSMKSETLWHKVALST